MHGRLPAPADEGEVRDPQHPAADGLRGDAHEPVGRELLLELRHALPAPAAPGAGRARHLLHRVPEPRAGPAEGLPRGGAGDARARRPRLPGLALRVERGRGAQEPAPDAHHGRLLARAPPARAGLPPHGRLHAAEMLLHRPRLPKRDAGFDSPCRVPPGGGVCRRQEHRAGPSHWRAPRVLSAFGYHWSPLQASIQSVHRALHGDLRLSSTAAKDG
mmetsp:Transcript_85062/g.241067  ORF Transcript_85062/g.241067 Transcript_85062/m.241067 type:complete len:217 (-) Transcript_85062:301-951(-)